MRQVRMHNGRVVDATDIKLSCADCGRLRDYEAGEGEVVYCGECGKKHRRNALVDTNTPLEGKDG